MPKKFSQSLKLLAAVMVTASCVTTHSLPARSVARASLATSAGLPVGDALIAQVGDRLTLTLKLVGLPPGLHGAHLHATGKCEVPDFASAGGHLNPMGKMHGALNPAGSHMGDLPNVMVTSDGTAHATLLLEGNPAEIEKSLFDADGSAIVIHAGQDDYLTNPSGNSGARIACGILSRQ